MDMRRLRAGELIAATGGAVLFVSLFLPWYRPGELTAWKALAVTDVVLALVAAAAVSLLVVTAAQDVPAVPTAMASLIALFGLIGLVLLLVQVVWLPGIADERAWGLWLGLAGAAAIVGGGLVAMRDQRLSKPGKWTDGTGRPTARPPEIEVRTLPTPGGHA